MTWSFRLVSDTELTSEMASRVSPNPPQQTQTGLFFAEGSGRAFIYAYPVFTDEPEDKVRRTQERFLDGVLRSLDAPDTEAVEVIYLDQTRASGPSGEQVTTPTDATDALVAFRRAVADIRGCRPDRPICARLFCAQVSE